MVNNKDIIALVKDDVIEIANKLRKKHSYPSDIISVMIYLAEAEKITEEIIIEKNNPLGITDPKTGEVETFASIQQCLIVADSRKLTWDDETYKKKKSAICKANKLSEIDKEFVYSKDDNVIDMSTENKTPKVDKYTVTAADGTVNSAESKEDALDMATANNGVVTDSRGRVVVDKKKSFDGSKAQSLTLDAGAVVTCTNVNMYEKFNSESPKRIINGQFYLYDGINYFGRMAICLTADHVANHTLDDIFGFINATDIQ